MVTALAMSRSYLQGLVAFWCENTFGIRMHTLLLLEPHDTPAMVLGAATQKCYRGDRVAIRNAQVRPATIRKLQGMAPLYDAQECD